MEISQVPVLGSIPVLAPCLSDLGQCADALKIGLFNGLIIALIAMGYTLVYGILQLINFANGDVFMTGSMLTFFGISLMGLSEASPPLSIVVGLVGLLLVIMLITAGMNASIERLAYRPLRNAPTLATLISAIGMFSSQNVGQILLGPSPSRSTRLSHHPLLIALPGSSRTRAGARPSGDRPGPQAAGLRHQRQPDDLLTFLLAGARAGGAGLVVALFYGQAWWFFGFPFGLLAFTAAVLGGIGNLTGAALGGVMLGLVRALNERYVDPRWTDVVVFSILIIVLVFRPTGLLGAKQAEGS